MLFRFMVSKIDKFSSFPTILKSINPINPNDTPRLVPKSASSYTEHVRQYLANFLIISRELWLPLLGECFGLSPRTYSKPSYSGYANIPILAQPSVSFSKRVPNS